MKSSLTKLALDNRVTTTVALLVVIFAGSLAFTRMPRDEDPGFIIRFAQVLTHYPGANPQRMEMLVSDKIEKVVQEIPEVKTVYSTNLTGTSIVLVQVKAQYRDMRPIWDNLRRKVDKARPGLPSSVIGPTVNDEFGDVFGIVVALTGEGYSNAELKKVADEVREELLLLPDVAKVSIHGAQAERIFVEFSSARLAQLGLSTYQLVEILKKRNIIIPGGYLQTQDERIALEPSGNFESIDEIRQTVVSIPGKKDVLALGDIVTIKRGYIDPPSERVRFSNRPALAVGVSMREGGNMVELGRQVAPVIERLQNAYPWGIDFNVVAFQPDVVTKKTDEFTNSLLQAIGIVIAVMLLTLGLRTGLVVASLIPSAIIMAILVMNMLGIGLDQMSLASLIIALGLLVDNAIVMSESILVQMTKGKKVLEAAFGSARELKVPLLVASLTTAASFLPIFLAESEVGEYTAPLFKVVTITLLCSWVLALTITPLLCVVFLRLKKKQKEQGDSWLTGFYRPILVGMLRRRALSVVVITLAFFGVMGLGRYVPNIFFPAQITKQFIGDLKLPAGTPIEKTERIVAQIDRFIEKELKVGPRRKEGIADWTVYIGNGGPKFRLAYNSVTANAGYAGWVMNATSPEVVPEIQRKLNDWCKQQFPDAETNFKDFAYGPPVDNPIEVTLLGRNQEQVFAKADEIKRKLRQIQGTRNIGDNWGRQVKKLVVKVNQARARRAGVTSQDIALSLQTIFSGFADTDYREGDKVIPISLRSVAADRTDLGKIETLSVYAQGGGKDANKPVPLKQVADVELQWSPGKILREGRLKALKVTSQLQSGVLASQVVAQLEPWLAETSKSWGTGLRYKIGGADEASKEGNQSILEKLPIAGFLILMLLVSQFNGLRKPLIILTTIPLAMIGVILGLLIARSYMGFMTLLGIISLAGIVINNGIVLLDRIRIEMEESGRTPQDAIVTAAQLRIRPILLTTTTTIGGMIPLWLGGGPMWEPMAIAIIFGLLFSTVLTLGFVPVCYALFFRVSYKSWPA